MINEFIAEGKIVPVAITLALLRKAMYASGKTRFLVDGFPRNMDNLTGWAEHMSECSQVEFLLYINCSEQVMEERILGRGAAAAQAGAEVRADDNAAAVKKRFATYLESTVPIIDHFKAQGKCREVDSSPPADEVFAMSVQPLFTKL